MRPSRLVLVRWQPRSATSTATARPRRAGPRARALWSSRRSRARRRAASPTTRSRSASAARYPCSGDGPAKVTFGAASFDGADEGGKVTACTGTQFDWADGCTWTSAQTVTGSVASGTLRFTYGEAPKSRASTCASTGSLRVERGARAVRGRRARSSRGDLSDRALRPSRRSLSRRRAPFCLACGRGTGDTRRDHRQRARSRATPRTPS